MTTGDALQQGAKFPLQSVVCRHERPVRYTQPPRFNTRHNSLIATRGSRTCSSTAPPNTKSSDSLLKGSAWTSPTTSTYGLYVKSILMMHGSSSAWRPEPKSSTTCSSVSDLEDDAFLPLAV